MAPLETYFHYMDSTGSSMTNSRMSAASVIGLGGSPAAYSEVDEYPQSGATFNPK